VTGAQKITPFLWFGGDVEEAAKFYVSVFKDARIESLHRPAPGKLDIAGLQRAYDRA
jgi:predicted 3-demethylubiquinone-9 3-methyltransferase (glyoxalase superfamily)